MVTGNSTTGASWDTEADVIARDVIDLCAAALRDLSEGQPLPAHWLSYLKQSAWPQPKRGRKPIPRNTQRDTEIAQLMLDHYIAIEKGKTDKGITAFAEELAEQYHDKGRKFEAKDIFEIYRRYEVDVMSQELQRRLNSRWHAENQARIEQGKRINTRVAAGESLDTILRDESISVRDFAEIRRHQVYGTELYGASPLKRFKDYSERKRDIFRWVNEGLNLGVGHDSVTESVMRAGADLAPHKMSRKPGK